MEGGVVGLLPLRDDLAASIVHSSSDNNFEQGMEGFVRAINVIVNRRQATILIKEKKEKGTGS